MDFFNDDEVFRLADGPAFDESHVVPEGDVDAVRMMYLKLASSFFIALVFREVKEALPFYCCCALAVEFGDGSRELSSSKGDLSVEGAVLVCAGPGWCLGCYADVVGHGVSFLSLFSGLPERVFPSMVMTLLLMFMVSVSPCLMSVFPLSSSRVFLVSLMTVPVMPMRHLLSA